jgi:hypothetical protein
LPPPTYTSLLPDRDRKEIGVRIAGGRDFRAATISRPTAPRRRPARATIRADELGCRVASAHRGERPSEDSTPMTTGPHLAVARAEFGGTCRPRRSSG